MKNSRQIAVESSIIRAVSKDNFRGNTIHFRWDRLPETPADFILEVLTCNHYNGRCFLLKRVFDDTENNCLLQMLDYVEKSYVNEPTWTVEWTNHRLETCTSIFRGLNEDDVRDKFFYDSLARSTIKSITKEE